MIRQDTVIAELADRFEFISNGSKEQDKSLAVMEKALDETTRNQKRHCVHRET